MKKVKLTHDQYMALLMGKTTCNFVKVRPTPPPETMPANIRFRGATKSNRRAVSRAAYERITFKAVNAIDKAREEESKKGGLK